MVKGLKIFGYALYVLQTLAILTKNFDLAFGLTVGTTMTFIIWTWIGDKKI